MLQWKNWKKREVVEYYDSGEIKERNIYNSDGDLIETKYYDINWNDPIEYYENWQIKRYKTYYGNWQIQREENYNEEWNYDWKYTEYYSNWQILEEIKGEFAPSNDTLE